MLVGSLQVARCSRVGKGCSALGLDSGGRFGRVTDRQRGRPQTVQELPQRSGRIGGVVEV